jgi:cellulose synthase/poly-beta-1,6-N-acetylglucosamine synthase-like glycosyltransferase
MTPQEISLFIYNLALLPVIFFSVLLVMLAFINLFIDRKRSLKETEPANFPFVSVQVPTYNDPVADRCIRQCLKFDYPKDKYEIIIADDSTDSSTQKLLKSHSDENPEFVKYIHRDNRDGYKAGALKNAMAITKGEILVIFDSDWIPESNFLKRIVQPFSDKKVAIVQSRQGFYNHNTNIITRFAAYTLMVYHRIIVPIENRLNCVFFCGTAGAIRRSMMEDVGGWNPNSLTEDSELSVRLMRKGYKSVYLDFETPSEVPSTLESYIKQQMRWCYGNSRIFFDQAGGILMEKKLNLRQKALITFILLGNVIAPLVVIMTIFGLAGWFLGEPTLFSIGSVINLVGKFLVTGGFLFTGAIALYKSKSLRELPQLILASFTMGLVTAIGTSFAFFRAAANKKLNWFCTPKNANEKFV